MAGEKDPQVSNPKSKVDETDVIKSSTPYKGAANMKSPSKDSQITRFFPKSPQTQQGKEKLPGRHMKSSSEDKDNTESSKEIDEGGAAKATDIPLEKTETKATAQGVKGKKARRRVQQTKTTKSKSASSQSRSKRGNKTVTQTSTLKDYFPVRRSARKCKSDIEAEKQKNIQEAILSRSEEGLAVKEFEGKGRGVVATKAFKKGDFVIEYAGDLIDLQTAKEREQKYAGDPSIGCYIYYFSFNDKSYCIDATAESGRLGRLINHSKTEANCMTRKIGINDTPYLILVAKRDIQINEELLYDYGDRSKTSLAAHPWLSS
ncbi:N-lysine methyltransferase KMT5A-like [Glandiceps talaboti]